MLNNKIKTLKVGILGEPNTGKSTLFNVLLKKKYSIVTRKAQTTIKNNSAVLIRKNKQIIFTDTPGILTYKKNINRAIFKEASNIAFEVDVVLLLFSLKNDDVKKIKEAIQFYVKHKIDFILLLNKIDLLSSEIFYKKVSSIKSIFKREIIFSISAKKNIGIDQFINYLIKNKNFMIDNLLSQKDLSTNPFYFKEIVREKILENIHDEIPFKLKFSVDKFIINKDKSTTLYITIHVKKLSYKPIIIGKKGENIKKISMLARQELEKNFNKKFHLFLFIKIIKKSSKIVKYRK